MHSRRLLSSGGHQSGEPSTYAGWSPPKIDRLMQGQKAWPQLGLGRVLRPKKIILNDWTASEWSFKKTDEVIAQLAGLLQQQFEIFLWQSGTLVPLVQDTLPCLKGNHAKSGMCAEYESVIYAAAYQQHRIPADYIQILDDWWVESLLQDDFTHPRSIDAEYFGKQENTREKLLDVLVKSTPALTEIYYDPTSMGYSENDVNELRDYFPAANVKPVHGELYLHENQLLHIFDKGELIDLYHTSRAEEEMEPIPVDLKRITDSMESIIYGFPEDDYVREHACLVNLISGSAQLKKLDLRNFGFFDEAILSAILKLEYLEDISFCAININADQLHKLTKKFSSLRCLDLNSCDELFQTPEATEAALLGLEKLERLSLEYLKISHVSFLTLLEGFSELREIHLTSSPA